jgi:hypothetical protein
VGWGPFVVSAGVSDSGFCRSSIGHVNSSSLMNQLNPKAQTQKLNSLFFFSRVPSLRWCAATEDLATLLSNQVILVNNLLLLPRWT